jgi:hypothetical protein
MIWVGDVPADKSFLLPFFKKEVFFFKKKKPKPLEHNWFAFK